MSNPTSKQIWQSVSKPCRHFTFERIEALQFKLWNKHKPTSQQCAGALRAFHLGAESQSERQAFEAAVVQAALGIIVAWHRQGLFPSEEEAESARSE